MKLMTAIFCTLVMALAFSPNWKAFAAETGYSLDATYSGSSVKDKTEVK